MSYQIEGNEYATFDGVPSDTPAWRTLNLEELWRGPDTRGSDRVIPGTAGVRSYRRRATVSRRQLLMVFVGDYKWDGTKWNDPREGLDENITHWRTNVSDPTVAAPGTRTAVLYLPSGAVTGAVTIESLELRAGDGPFVLNAVMDLSIPGGSLS